MSKLWTTALLVFLVCMVFPYTSRWLNICIVLGYNSKLGFGFVVNEPTLIAP